MLLEETINCGSQYSTWNYGNPLINLPEICFWIAGFGLRTRVPPPPDSEHCGCPLGRLSPKKADPYAWAGRFCCWLGSHVEGNRVNFSHKTTGDDVKKISSSGLFRIRIQIYCQSLRSIVCFRTHTTAGPDNVLAVNIAYILVCCRRNFNQLFEYA